MLKPDVKSTGCPCRCNSNATTSRQQQQQPTAAATCCCSSGSSRSNRRQQQQHQQLQQQHGRRSCSSGSSRGSIVVPLLGSLHAKPQPAPLQQQQQQQQQRSVGFLKRQEGRVLPFAFAGLDDLQLPAANSNSSSSSRGKGLLQQRVKDLLQLFRLTGSSSSSSSSLFDSAAASAWRSWVSSLPPVSRVYLLLSAAATAAATAAAAAGRPVPVSLLQFEAQKVFKKGEVWRLFSPFFFFGEASVSAALSLSFAYTYLPLLERYCSSSSSSTKEGSHGGATGSSNSTSNATSSSNTEKSLQQGSSSSRSSSGSSSSSRRAPRFSRLLLFGAGCTYSLVSAGLLPAAQQQQCFFSYLLFLWSRLDPTGEAEVFGSLSCSNAALPLLLLLQHLLLDGQLLQADLWGAAAALAFLALNPKP
ncbi:hypothetical protein Efla_003463 [Eimeria flavescens]